MTKRSPENGSPSPPPDLPSDARERLEFIRKAIIANDDGFGAMEYAANVIGSFLDGKSPSLDHAFGIRKGPGRPKRPLSKHLKLALQVYELRCRNTSWKKICSDLNFKDERKLRAIAERYQDAVGQYYFGKIDAMLNSLD